MSEDSKFSSRVKTQEVTSVSQTCKVEMAKMTDMLGVCMIYCKWKMESKASYLSLWMLKYVHPCKLRSILIC